MSEVRSRNRNLRRKERVSVGYFQGGYNVNPLKKMTPLQRRAKKPQKYPYGRSRVIYIGTTGKGTQRPAVSAVNKASEAFGELRGVKEIDTYIVTSGTRQSVRTWEHLESSLLAIFVGRYHHLPKYNKKRGSIRYAEDVTLFRRKPLEQIILRFVK